MGPGRSGWLTRRSLRAIGLMAAGLALVAAASFQYWNPGRPGASPGTPTPSTASPAQSLLLDMAWTSPETGWLAVGAPSTMTLLRTTDGGRHWRRQLAGGFFMQMQFLDARQGYVLRASPRPQLLETADGGQSWNARLLPDHVSSSARVHFLDAADGWLTSYLPPYTNAGTGSGIVLYRTRDGARSWRQVLSAAAGASHGLGAEDLKGPISFADPLRGAMGSVAGPGGPGAYVTGDGGAVWRPVALPPPPGGWPPGESLTEPVLEMGAGGEGLLIVSNISAMETVGWAYRTLDEGRSWRLTGPLPAAAGPTYDPAGHEATLSTMTAQIAWYGFGTRTWVSTDAGASWAGGTSLPGGWWIAQLAPLSASTAWCGAVRATSNALELGLFRTMNGGSEWARIPAPMGG
ncbi:MAG: hypothetical protein ACREPA_02675 [Candidatus Dormibacteraceae bacterium]